MFSPNKLDMDKLFIYFLVINYLIKVFLMQ
jgi:hypothetical protein